MEDHELKRRFYPEANIGGFSHVDGTVALYSQVAAILKPTDYVLDFGAGRGEPLLDDPIAWRRSLCDFRGRCQHLEGCDIDEAVLSNPFLDHAKIIAVGEPLPYDDNTFDLVIARSVFEHVDTPRFTAGELLRVTKPGGVIAAVTPNRWGYIAIGARLIPNRLHVRALNSIQPERKAEDVFPTRYLMNTPRALRRAFHGAEVFVTPAASEPKYHFGNPCAYRLIKWITKHLPDACQPILFVYIRKPQSTSRG